MLGFCEQEAISLHINLGQCEQLQGFYLQKIKIWLGWKILADNIMIPAPFLSQSKLNGEEYLGILNCLFGNVVFFRIIRTSKTQFFYTRKFSSMWRASMVFSSKDKRLARMECPRGHYNDSYTVLIPI